MGFSWLLLWGIILINSLCLIVEATLRKDRSRYRPFPWPWAASPSSALLLPCPSRGKPPEGFFRGRGRCCCLRWRGEPQHLKRGSPPDSPLIRGENFPLIFPKLRPFPVRAFRFLCVQKHNLLFSFCVHKSTTCYFLFLSFVRIFLKGCSLLLFATCSPCFCAIGGIRLPLLLF